MRVKICGIANVRDALTAVEAGTDAIGLVFAESPRRVSLAQAKEIVKAVGPWIATVGVFVNEPIRRVIRIATECRLTALQLHGEESPSYTDKLKGWKLIKAFRIDENFDWVKLRDYIVDAFLFDTPTTGAYGGTGKIFDWGLLKGRRIPKPFILSGGLRPGNVARATRLVSPYGVDVSSGVERSPGRKDPRLVREFIRNAKK